MRWTNADIHVCMITVHKEYIHVHVHVFNLEMRRKKEASKVKQTNKAKQHSTPKAVTFPRKNEHMYM